MKRLKVVDVLRKIRFGFLAERLAGLFHSAVAATSMFTIAEATPGHYHTITHKATPKLVLFVMVTNAPAVHGFTCFVVEKRSGEEKSC